MTTVLTTRDVGVALCGDLERETGLELAAVARRLKGSVPNVDIEIVPNLCHSPKNISSLASRAGAGRLALGLCARPTYNDEFQACMRKAGLDPFAVELVDLHGAESAENAALVLGGAVARLTAFAGSKPEQLKLRLVSFEQRRSRRSLFTLPPTTYTAVASIEKESCLGERCGLCVDACPLSAIGAIAGVVTVDRERCQSCGACVTSCPTSAVAFPGSTLSEYEAEITVLLSAEEPNLLFACRHALDACGKPPLSAVWLPVEVPCLGMVTPGWILQSLAHGASTVALLGCGGGCLSGSFSGVRDQVDFVQELLHLLGESAPSRTVPLLYADSELPRMGASPASTNGDAPRILDGRGISLLEPGATAGAIVALGNRYEASPGVSLTHNGSPLGIVTLREETCTACGACPSVCPTEALLSEEHGQGETIVSFDAGRCVACGNCVRVCPEQALDTLSVDSGIDVLALTRGRVVLKRARSASCRRCGRSIAPDAMLNRIRTLLGTDDTSGPLIATLTELCSDCRALESTPSAGA